jgi:hypothetical protein
VQGDHKLVRRKEGAYELYDLAADPLEQHDLAPAGGELYEDLEEQVEAFATRLAEEKRKGAKVKIDEEEADQLEALGYIEGE